MESSNIGRSHDRPGSSPPPPGLEAGANAESRPPGGPAVPPGRLWGWALGAALLAGLAAWLVGEGTVEVFRPKLQTMMTMMGPMEGATNAERARAASWNAALAYTLLGAFLGLAMGLAAGLARKSPRAAFVAGAVGLALGAILALVSSLALQPLYYRSIEQDPLQQSLTMPMLVHAGIWATVGAAGGIALGLGLGSHPRRFALIVLGGLVGAVLAAVTFEMIGALLLSREAETTRPVSLTWSSRLLACLLVALLASAGAAAV